MVKHCYHHRVQEFLAVASVNIRWPVLKGLSGDRGLVFDENDTHWGKLGTVLAELVWAVVYMANLFIARGNVVSNQAEISFNQLFSWSSPMRHSRILFFDTYS